MTPTAWGALLASVVLVGGLVFSARLGSRRRQVAGMALAILGTVVIGWVAWYIGITPASA